MKKINYISFIILGLLFSAEPVTDDSVGADSQARVGAPFPGNPLNDRAKGYLVAGKAKTAVSNFGNFIDWDFGPSGLWGQYSYLPNVSFIAGVAGHSYSSDYSWVDDSEDLSNVQQNTNQLDLYCSSQVYNDWQNYRAVVFNMADDKGDIGEEVEVIEDFSVKNQFWVDEDGGRVCISLNKYEQVDPEKSNAMIGLAYPWSIRPKFMERPDANTYDVYDYGVDREEWTEDDVYEFYGSTVSESHFSRYSDKRNSDWQATDKSKVNTHQTDIVTGDIFGDEAFTDANDTYPMLAHSNFSNTWPVVYNSETGLEEPFWPGWFAKDYYGDDPSVWADVGVDPALCDGKRSNQDCWVESSGRHVSDTDVYMEFDDRWAHRGNMYEDDSYKQTGYPLGLSVKAMGHSYGVAYAEDIMFVTVKVRNESGAYYDENGEYHQGMLMPDGTRLNRGQGFDYKDLFLGFYMDADVLTGDINGYNSGLHTNNDDFMEYYWERFSVNDDSLRISMALVYDYDGISGGAGGADIGIVAAQLLDTPLATENIDLDKNGSFDIYAGEPLKMTDWHWFDWLNRPGVLNRENPFSCFAGRDGCPQPLNKEEIMYKIMAGDTTNLTVDEKRWFFHTPNPDVDSDLDLNPHFDSLEGLASEPNVIQDPYGLDCVLIFSCGPFDIEVGEEVPFSFCIIFGQDKDDLINNAKFAQVMYNSNYQGFTPPSKPIVIPDFDHAEATLKWTTSSKYSRDVVTGYSDFEGFKVYRSLDGGLTWGNSDDKIYDTTGVFVGWEPYEQFDLSAFEDSVFCVKGFNSDVIGNGSLFNTWDDCVASETLENNPDYTNCCSEGLIRGASISGADPYAPWYDLGSDTGLDQLLECEPSDTGSDICLYTYVDDNVVDGFEYTYAVTAYDMGVSGASETVGGDGTLSTTYIANPDEWANPKGYQSIETSRGTTVYDPNFVVIVPGYKSSTSPTEESLKEITVVPNPYVAASNFNETAYLKKMLFTHLPAQCTINIYTITGEMVTSLTHDDPVDGKEWWDLRSINNQEVSPGLYIYTVESTDNSGKAIKHVGKFAIIR